MADEAETPTETPEAASETAVAAVVISDAPVPVAALTIEEMDKDQLEAYARENFGRELDKRKRLPALQAEVRALLDGSTQRAEAAEQTAVEAAIARASSQPILARHRILKNPETDEFWEFEWNPLYEGNADLEPIYAE